MEEVVRVLLELINKYGVKPKIWFEKWIGENNLFVEFSIGKFHIQRCFYYVSVGDDTFKNFMSYNPQFNLVIEKMAEELLKKYNADKEGAEE